MLDMQASMKVLGWSASLFFGGSGIFRLVRSFSDPDSAIYAVLFLGMATAIAWGLEDRSRRGAARK